MPAKWKVEFPGKKDLLLQNFRPILGCFKTRYREAFKVYYLEGAEWKWCYTNNPDARCRCGREYNGFRMRRSFMNTPKLLAEQLAWFELPILCMYCYYAYEQLEGNWIPREVRKALGLEK